VGSFLVMSFSNALPWRFGQTGPSADKLSYEAKGIRQKSLAGSTSKLKSEFKYTTEENSALMLKILSSLPMAQTATYISSSPAQETENAYDGITQKTHTQLHMIAVSFSRTDYMPMMYFQVKEELTRCQTPSEYCAESSKLVILGPSKTASLHNDFGAFPKSKNAFKLSLLLEKMNAPAEGEAADYKARATWGFELNGYGFDEYLQYFRKKAGAEKAEGITMPNIQVGIANWTQNLSKSIF